MCRTGLNRGIACGESLCTVPLMETELFNYHLPPELIAQHPADERDQSRLFHYDRASGERRHSVFAKITEFLQPGDLLVFNDTKVIPARLRGLREETGGNVEFLLLENAGGNQWWSLLKPGKRLRPGSTVRLTDRSSNPTGHLVTVLEKNAEGHGLIRFENGANVPGIAVELGEMPLPPYIAPDASRQNTDLERYQTVYAREPGSVAAPTAGLHFSNDLIHAIKQRGVETAYVTLKVGLGTFAPVKADRITDHKMHSEHYTVREATADAINAARNEGRRVIPVGTTSLRTIETVARDHAGLVVPCEGSSDIFIYPPYQFQIADALITNFHLPRSTLLMLISAFLAPGSDRGIEIAKSIYQEAIDERYRFFSYGDGMFIG